ncbi:putative 6-hydroxynicotinate 3-monooxygenase [Glarea lozoyensis 74030]|uniref:Putative 6-hydroxynicotinate 3-monooxygenase n=1 Tax=Glarea lozoyensis (strain ATCC 74030 / MF5533) TaxID=1104152 RepID=H0EEZ8_GLAL7|nr:putative 6-hydroxynicotinate 3-monooxygenase [Glarea lozoyensis 74030]
MLQVIIVGSGLAGLTAARVLREHHNVTVYERGDERIATGGQGIMIAPNGHNILQSLGYEPERVGAVPIHGIRFYNKQDNVTEDVALNLKAQFGAEYMSQKRSDFRDELLRLATTASDSLGIEGDPAKVVFGVSVIGLDPESGTVTLSDGSTMTADVVIISTEDAKTALGDIPLPHWWEPSTCQNQDSTKPATESWYAAGDSATVVELFGDFHKSLVKILGAASEVKVWELQDLDPIPTWTRGRAILIGDAAHAMTPMQGQGANMCIEDAESFRLFAPGTRSEEVQDILKTIGTIRKARTAEVLAETRKSHSTTGIGQRVLKNLEFNCGYKGIFEAVKSFEVRGK